MNVPRRPGPDRRPRYGRAPGPSRPPRWPGWPGMLVLLAIALIVYRAWLEPGNVSAWLGTWIRGLCT